MKKQRDVKTRETENMKYAKIQCSESGKLLRLTSPNLITFVLTRREIS